MAAQKSTASSVPRKRKTTKPGGNRIKSKSPELKRIETIPAWVVIGPEGDEIVYLSEAEAEVYADPELRVSKARIDERIAVIVDRKAQRVTSKERYGIMVGDRLVSTHANLSEASKQMGSGYLVAMICNDKDSRDAEWQSERRRLRRQTNPLAEKLASEHSYVLYALGEELGDIAELHEPSGRMVRPIGDGRRKRDGRIRRATDAEAVLSELHFGKHFTVDVRGDVPGQVVAKLTEYIKELQATVRRVKKAEAAGIFVPLTDEERAQDELETGKAVTA